MVFIKKYLNKKYIFPFIGILTIFFAFLFLCNYTKYNFLIRHDRYFIFYDIPSLFSFGRFCSRLSIIILFKVIPSIFTQFNLNDIENTIAAYFKASVIIIMVYTYVKVFYMFSKEKMKDFSRKSFPFVFLIIFFLFFNNYNIWLDSILEIGDTVTFLDWGFNLIFYFLFMYVLAKIFIKKRVLSTKQMLFAVFLAFLLSISNEMYCVSAFISLSILLFIMFFSFIFPFEKIKQLIKRVNFSKYKQLSLIYEENNNTKKPEKTIFFQLLFIQLSMVIGGILFFFLSNYSSLENAGGGHVVNWREQILLVPINLKPFIEEFINIYIYPYFLIYLIILLSILYILYKKPDNKSIKLLSFLFLIYAGVLAFILALIFGGTTNNGGFFLSHAPFIYSYIKILLFICVFLIGYIMNTLTSLKEEVNQNNFIVAVIFILIFSVFYKYVLVNYFSDYKKYIKQTHLNRQVSYVSDKIALISYKYDGIIQLPFPFYFTYRDLLYMYDYNSSSQEDFEYYIFKILIEETRRNRSRIYTYDCNDYEKYYDNKYLEYIRNIYNIRPNYMLIVTDGDLRNRIKEKNINFKLTDREKKRLKFSDLKFEPFTLDEINEIIIKNPDKNWGYAARGRYYYLNKQYKKSIDDYTKAINLKDDIYYHLLRANVYRDAGMLEKALKDYEVVLKYDRLSLLLADNVAKIMIKLKKYEDAIKIYDRLIQLFPFGIFHAYKDFYYERAELKQLTGDYKGAVKDFEKSEEINPYTFRFNVNYNIANLQFKLKNYKDAVNNYTEELNTGNYSAEIYYLRGLAYIKLKKYNLAVDDFINYMENTEEDDENLKKNIKEIKKYIKFIKRYDKQNKYEGIEKAESILKEDFFYI